jgi:hypothetical protein
MSTPLENGENRGLGIELDEESVELIRELLSSRLVEHQRKGSKMLEAVRAEQSAQLEQQRTETLSALDQELTAIVGDDVSLNPVKLSASKRGPATFSDDTNNFSKQDHIEIAAANEAIRKALEARDQKANSAIRKRLEEGLRYLRGTNDSETPEAAAAGLFHDAMNIRDAAELKNHTLLELAYAASTNDRKEAEKIYVGILEGNLDTSNDKVINGSSILKHTPADLITGAHVGLAALYKKQLDDKKDLRSRDLDDNATAELEEGVVRHFEAAHAFTQVKQRSAIDVLYGPVVPALANKVGQIKQDAESRQRLAQEAEFQRRISSLEHKYSKPGLARRMGRTLLSWTRTALTLGGRKRPSAKATVPGGLEERLAAMETNDGAQGAKTNNGVALPRREEVALLAPPNGQAGTHLTRA